MMQNLTLFSLSLPRDCLSGRVVSMVVKLKISSLQNPFSIVSIALTVMAMECYFIVSTSMIILRSGSEVDARAARASAEVFSPLGIRVRSNLSN